MKKGSFGRKKRSKKAPVFKIKPEPFFLIDFL